MRHNRVHVILLERQHKRATAIETLLSAQGYAVSIVASPAALIETLAQHSASVAILDILDPAVAEIKALHALPNMSGTLALVLVARKLLRHQHTKFLEFQSEEWTIVSHTVASISDAVEKGAQYLERSRGLVRVSDTILDTVEGVQHTVW